MKERMFSKGLAVTVIILFVGVGIQPAYATVQPETEMDVEPKDYLFQTIIYIANNQDIKNLLEQHKYDFFKVDVNSIVYRNLLLRNPILFFNTLLTKPSISIDYLNKCYNEGIEITKIIGEKEALELIESIEITNTQFLDELNSFIISNENLFNRFIKLKEINKELKSDILIWEDHPIICIIIVLILITLTIIIIPAYRLRELLQDKPMLILKILVEIWFSSFALLFAIPYLYFWVECIGLPTYA